MTSDGDGVDSDGTSPDTIFRELCMLRCSSCSNYSKNNSHVSSQCEPLEFNHYFSSQTTDVNSTLDPTSWKSTDSPGFDPCLDTSHHYYLNRRFKNDSSTQSDFKENLLSKRQSVCRYLKDSCDPYYAGSLWSRNLLSESFSRISPVVDSTTCNFSSRGTDTPHFDAYDWFKEPKWRVLNYRSDSSHKTSLSESEGSSVEYLVKDRCNSPDCACDKQYATQVLSFKPRIRLTEKRSRPKSVGSQVTETSLGLKLADWKGQIVIQEEDLSMESSRAKKRLETESEVSVPSVLRLCQVSSASEHSSDSAITFLKKCSDCNILTTLGLKRDPTISKLEMDASQNMTTENTDGKVNKGQMVETYGKLLNKIEKIKKMTSWKSKRRKNKLKYTLQGNEFQQEIMEHSCCKNDNEKYNWKGDDNQRQKTTTLTHLSSGDTPAGVALSRPVATDALTCPDPSRAEFKNEDVTERQSVRTCDIGVQSVLSESFMTTIESSVDHNYQTKNQERKMSQRDDVIQTVVSQLQTNLNECLKKKDCSFVCPPEQVEAPRVRPQSITSTNSSNFMQGLNESLLNWGGRETQEEILLHLREINKLIERESSVSSTHRTCLSERSLGFEADKTTSSKRISKPKIDKSDYSRRIKKDGRVYWAVTKVTVYPDSCRTYEVMRLSRKRPQNIPSTSETIFVLLPNK